MLRKPYSQLLTAAVLLLSVFIISDVAHPHPETKFASWNIRILSDKSRDNTELRQIAQTLTDFDDDKAANDAVSDHRPVWAVFSINRDDDGPPAETAGSDASQQTVYVTKTRKSIISARVGS